MSVSNARKSAHVLIIDDDQEIVRGAKTRLRAAGYAVTTAFDGLAGLQAAAENMPDVILLDMRMPLMDGLTMLEELRKRAEMQNVPVIVLSANVAETAKRQALGMGADFFLEKPYDGLVLVQAIDIATGNGETRLTE